MEQVGAECADGPPHPEPHPAMRSLLSPNLALCSVLVALASALTGCVSGGYKLAEKTTAPAVPLGWQTGTSPVDLTLQTVVVYRGPGSWKANAYWDEYVVSLRNQSDAPVTLTRALLTDFRGELAITGDNPWTLEKQSNANTQKISTTVGNVVRVGAGVVLPTMAAMTVSGVAAGVAMVGVVVNPAFLFVGPAMFPVAIGATVYRNISSKHQIEAEFARRRLTFPLTLAPGQELTGSLFFPVTPGPRRLQVQLEGQSLLAAIELPLPQLAFLHLEPVPADDSIPLQPVSRNGRHFLTIKMDTGAPAGQIVAGDRLPLFTPAEVEVEVDAQNRLLEELPVTATFRVRSTVRNLGKIILPAGEVPPAKVEFLDLSVRQTPFNETKPGLRETP